MIHKIMFSWGGKSQKQPKFNIMEYLIKNITNYKKMKIHVPTVYALFQIRSATFNSINRLHTHIVKELINFF